MLEKKSRPAGDRAALKNVMTDTITNNANYPEPQSASVHQVRALHLIASHHVRPAMALALAGLVFGETR